MAFEQERIEGRESMLTVAAVQFEPLLGDLERNRDKLVELVGQALEKGAQLIVTPEMGNTGYIFNTREEAFACSESVPDGPTVMALNGAARKGGGYIVAGILEKEGSVLYNASVLIGPEGCIGKYRKTHLWDLEKTLYEPGNLGYPVFDLPFGRVGMSICYDNWFPEVNRIYCLQGADIICHPTNWVVVPGLATPESPTWAYLAMAQAHTNGVFMVCAGRTGTERGVTFGGSSCICGLPGFVKGPAGGDSEEILIAELNVMDARRKRLSGWNHLIRDRRSDLYDEMLGYDGRQYPL